MRKLPLLRALQYFDAVSSFSSFSGAAESCGMTHGAISHQIRALEAWLGRDLFERHSGGVRLTDEGERLRQACAQAFSILEEACAQIRTPPLERTITIGCSATFLAHWLLPRVELFSRECPEPVLSFQTRSDVASVLAGKVDVLIVSESAAPPDGIEGIRLATDAIGPVCAPTWPDLPTSPEDMRQKPLLHAESRLSAWNEWASAAGVTFNRISGRRFETLSLTIEAARGGLGFAVTPEFIVRHDIDAGRLVAPLGFVKVERATWMYINEDRKRDHDLTTFCTWLVGRAKNEIANE